MKGLKTHNNHTDTGGLPSRYAQGVPRFNRLVGLSALAVHFGPPCTMGIDGYKYSIKQCDIPKSRRALLERYRAYRQHCLEYLLGDSPTSVMNQVYDLAWNTAIFRTLNEARRLEPRRTVSGALWELATDGYVSLMSIGIRRLIDRDSRTDSLWTLITAAERRPELLTRETFVCYDGLPFDYEAKQRELYSKAPLSKHSSIKWIPTTGPDAWSTSELLHKAFDGIISHTGKRRRLDRIDPGILVKLKAALTHPAIAKVCSLVDRRIAHAERKAAAGNAAVGASLSDFDAALAQIVKVANHLSTTFFYEAAFGSIVPIPQFDVLRGLDSPWVTKKNMERLHDFWGDLCRSMDGWTSEEPDFSFLSSSADPTAS